MIVRVNGTFICLRESLVVHLAPTIDIQKSIETTYFRQEPKSV